MILLSGITGSAVITIFILFFVLGIIPFTILQVIIRMKFKSFMSQLKQKTANYILFQLGIFVLSSFVTYLFLMASYWFTGKGLLE
ncbi:MAG: ABC-type uncharacterized transport system fused permease/ATPase subunit [Arenicella sp.]|jgi:ABC-type uncharacterized transport system fused permease/ATPase subunit